MKLFVLWFAILFIAVFTAAPHAATFNSDGSRTDVQAKIDAAVDGDIVTIPSGTFTWTSGVTISGKGIHIQGGGSGRAVGTSATLNSVPASYPTSRTFTVDADLTHSTAWNALRSQITAGATLKIWKTGGEIDAFVYGGNNGVSGNVPWMRGTVTSYNTSTRELVMSITSANWTTADRNVSYAPWVITTEATTTIIKNNDSAVTDSKLFQVTEDASHSVEFSGIRFEWASGSLGRMIELNPTTSGKPALVHDCFFLMKPGSVTGVYCFTTRGITWNNTYHASSFHNSSQPFIITALLTPTDAWDTVSTMGNADTTGIKNFYIEDSDFHGVENGTDFQDNGKGVVRYCVLNNSGIANHGPDTGFYGMRHMEVYKVDCVFNGYANGTTIALNHFVLFRGGTGLVTDCVIPNITSTDYPSKAEVRFLIEMLDRGGINGPWSDNDGQVPEYPVPRQVGMGRVTGMGVDGHGRSTDPNLGEPFGWPGAYVGDVEPIYIWNNSRVPEVVAQTGFEGGGGAAVDPDLAADYIQEDRDYIIDGTTKPGWTAYSYPHPLTNQTAVQTPIFSPAGGTYAAAQNVTITSGTSGATIRYTTNGSTPTSSSGTIYASPVAISSTTVLKAIAYNGVLTDSAVNSETYTITGTGSGDAVAATTTVTTTLTLP